MIIYPPGYEIEVAAPVVVSQTKKNSAIAAVKAHMTENRGYYIKELVEVVQAELHADDIHIRDDEVGVWIKELDANWGWHPEPEPVDPELKGK